MKKAIFRWMKAGLVMVLLVSSNLLPASAAPGSSAPVPVPVVFTSRNRLDTIDGEHVGPPVEILGREKAVGGKLMVLYPGGRLTDLTSGHLFDVARPMVSFDGSRIVFSGLRTAKSQWHIYQIKLDGSGLRQLTTGDRDWKIPADPNFRQRNQNSFGRYGDFSPAYLPDGRIIFSSSRYASLSASCGQRALNLYVMNGDGSEMHRITTERAGAVDPYVLASGRVVFSHWVDNMNTPAPAGPGLRPLEVDRNFGPSFWILWATNPDGTAAGRYAFNDGKFRDRGGLFQPREMPDGRLVYTYRAAGNLLGSTLSTGIALLTPGAGDGNTVKGIGDPVNLEGPHALSPAPLPDGRILFSYTPSSEIQVDGAGKVTARFNYGLYVTDDRFQNPTPLYDDPDTDEMDAVAVYPRTAAVLADIEGATRITDDPSVDLRTTALLRNSNIYADLPLGFREILSPTPGSVVAVDFYDDSQTFTTSAQFLLLRKQPPKFVGSVPVNPDGSFTATIPADRPIFWLLRTATGVVGRTVTSPPEATYTSFVPTHDYFRPGQVAECVGCHRGHMVNPDLTFKEAKTNLARLATATASSALNQSRYGPQHVNDSRLADSEGRYSWASRGEANPWVQLTWLAPITVDEVVLYPRSEAGNRIDRSVLRFSDGSSVSVAGQQYGKAPLKVSFPARTISWMRFQVEAAKRLPVGLAELVVHGAQVVVPPRVSPRAPLGLKATEGTVLLTWKRNSEPYLGGYRVHFGTAPGVYTRVLDVGNVDRFLMSGLTDGFTYYFSVTAYDIGGQETSGFSNEVRANFAAPRVSSVSPGLGRLAGGTTVTIRGSGFASNGVTVLFGGSHARVISARPGAIEVLTPNHKAGSVEVTVINPDGSRDTLPGGFVYVKP